VTIDAVATMDTGAMPTSSLRPCATPRCPTLVRSGRCDAHGGPRKAWQPSQHSRTSTRLRGHANQQRRRALFQREPFCRPCMAQGKHTIATIADHAIPLAEGGVDDMSNLESICRDCHQKKTQAESQRGVQRAR
jgi:5-methylcytosine-specific restriction protein A